ncbi:hypothetical protein DFS34DRAFT_630753 [Phlyctochytrium arcticum]|nr:hypothetical protein DFS34DRAFT_630753 [Phlyctochytrium arcticum]
MVDIEMGSDGVPHTPWETAATRLRALCQDTTSAILERRHASKFGVDTEELDRVISQNLEILKAGIAKLEGELSVAEESSGSDKNELRRWEEALLELSKLYDRTEGIARGEDASTVYANERSSLGLEWSRNGSRIGSKSVRFSNQVDSSPLGQDNGVDGELQAGEHVLLQQRIMDDQDSHLDELSATIERQKHIGLMINDELDLHVDLLEDTETRVDSTQQRLRGVGRRLERVMMNSTSSSRGTTVMCALFVILILVIVAARKM